MTVERKNGNRWIQSMHMVNVTLHIMIFYASVRSSSLICSLHVLENLSVCVRLCMVYNHVHMCSCLCEYDEENQLKYSLDS